jgi:sugar phosphate isomerase/epimerase
MIKLSVFTVMMPDCDLKESAKLLAENGYEGVEWRVTRVDATKANEPFSFWGNNRSTVNEDTILEKAQEVRELTKSAGLEIPNLACYQPASAVDKIDMLMRAAKIIGAPSIRVGVPRYDRSQPYPKLLAQARSEMAQMEKLAKKYGVKALIEIHMGTITPSASAAYRVVEGFDPKYVGAILDPGNMVHEGWENWKMGMEILGEYLGHVHAKNYRWVVAGTDDKGTVQWQPEAVPMEQGLANWGQVIADLKAIGYDGYISFEDFSNLPTKDKLARNAAYMRKLLA